MEFVKIALIISAVCTIYVNSLVVSGVNKDVINKNVERIIDISTQLVKISSKVTLENVGKSAVKSFLFAAETQFIDNLSFISAKDSSKRELRLTEASLSDDPKLKLWQVDLRDQLGGVSTTVVTIDCVFSKSLVPYPSSITQQEKQLVLYNGNHYYYSPYVTKSQTSVVFLSSRNVESYSKLKPVTHSDTSITYGPFADVAPYSFDPLSVHYMNNKPFLTVSRVDRLIEVSHWGNIAIEETVDVYHSGALLKGPFTRYDFQQDPSSGVSCVKSYKTLLPASASSVYYRDTNGNISTSHMRIKKDAVELELRPRFPLFGGWKTQYTLGYNVPSYEYLFHSGNEFFLKMRVIDHIFDDMVVDEVTTKIILPEGSSQIKLTAPYNIKRERDTRHFTYLDTKGRPVVTFSKKNLVENHIQDFQLRYTFPKLLMLQEPLLAVAFLYALFLCVIIYVRLDFRIHKDDLHKD